TYNGGAGFQLIQQAAGSGAIGSDFAGTIGLPTLSVAGGGAPGADPRFTFTTDPLVDNDNVTTNNSFVIRVRLIAANVQGNQAGTSLLADSELIYQPADVGGADTTLNTGAGVSATVREPVLTISKTVDTRPAVAGTQSDTVDNNDEVEYTIVIGNASALDAHDLRFSDVFPGVLNIDTAAPGTLQIKTGPAGFDFANAGADIEGQFVWNGRELKTIDGTDLDLAVGQTIVIKVLARANASVAQVATFDSNASLQWSSIDSDTNLPGDRNPNERDGADGLLNTANVLNDYRVQDGALVTVASGNSLSRVGGLADTTVPGGDTRGAERQAVGEIVRFRMVVRVPEGQISGLVVRPGLPAGYTYLGEATVALISTGGNDLSATNVGAGAGLDDGTPANFGDIEAGLDTTNDGPRPGVAITALLDNGNPYFALGDVSNTDNDADAEYVVIEFNAVVANVASNQNGSTLSSNFTVRSGGVAGALLGTSNTTVDTVTEALIPSIDKRLIGLSGGAQGATRDVVVRDSFSTGVGGLPAYEAVLTDSLPTATPGSYAFVRLQVGAATYATQSAAEAAGYSFDFTNGATVNFNGNAIAAGVTVSFDYRATVSTATNAAPTAATLTWSSLPDTAGSISQDGFAGSGVGPDGTATGERIGTGGLQGSGALNDYRLQEAAGLGTISGTLWDDTRDRNGTIDAGEARLANQTVTLTWAGADGSFGNGDDVVITTVTDLNGNYTLGALAQGVYRVDAPGTVTATIGGDTDSLSPVFDVDGNLNGLGTIDVGLNDGVAVTGRNVGYLSVNDAPNVNGLDATPTYVEGLNTSINQNVPGTPVLLDTTVTIVDIEIANGLDDYTGTTLTIARDGGNGTL
ncbi:MAG: hypothetical protein EOO24_18420, partial [Comamonadaceae bacterium]